MAKPKMQIGVKKNEVAKGKGAPVQAGNRSAPGLASKGIAKGAPVKRGVVENKVAAGNAAHGGVGTPAKHLGLDDSAIKNVANHGHTAPKGGNRFDIYAKARE